ncbi:SAM-dependent methyltransferase [Skermania piniformis]|uniref:Cyclopropane-fatty-acyl-phospholipid synthase family protein n=1 Tax=Skermania pinensis TaxID=39122 RepID=A0ABX8SDP6_9ACTN|nr:cyclopropane-fatty-acyl-phospholipid synthase family protein [Skermania piniformis]QXQ14735.1 cyclopropane-fatty-acyl-phospholipid synthase family protein [Skermania piniformis]
MSTSVSATTAEIRPDVALAAAPNGVRAAIAAPIAAALFRRAALAAGLRIVLPNGVIQGADDPAAPSMVIHEPRRFARRLGVDGLIGFGESYMAEEWSAADPAAVLATLAARMGTLVPGPAQRLRRWYVAARPAGERNSRGNSARNIAHHYDLSNEFFALFLDETMTYSSALFGALEPAPRTTDLAAAQRAKIDGVLDLAGVGPGTRLLEIGTGWGELALRAARRGALVHSVTLSARQRESALDRIAAAGLADRVRIDLRDYRAIEDRYDAVVSVEMIEAVGYEFLPDYFGAIGDALAPGGRAVIQAITMPHDRMRATRDTYTWIQKYIFPGGFLPSVQLLQQLSGAQGLTLAEPYLFGPHYAHTLRLWQEQLLRNEPAVAALGFDAAFRRMWRLYLAYAEAGFRSGYLDVGWYLLTRAELR